MSTDIQKPSKELFASEYKRLESQRERDEKITELLTSVPEDDPDREELIKVLKQATAFDANYSVRADRSELTRKNFFKDQMEKKRIRPKNYL